MKLILASKSPRRKQILSDFGYDFCVSQANFKETDLKGNPVETAKANALGKAQAVYNNLDYKNAVVLGADTVVYLDGEILGKPIDDRDALSTLLRLSNKTHSVVTGYAIISEKEQIVGFSESKVTFNNLDLELIFEYVKSGLPLDKAGSYGIQDGYGLVKEYSGSLNNIIGLPIEDIKQALDKLIEIF